MLLPLLVTVAQLCALWTHTRAGTPYFNPAQAIAEVLAALKVVALEARMLDLPAKQAIS